MRALVFASYNIHRGLGLDRRLDLDRTAAVIAEIGPDVIGLQEVIREVGAHAGPDADEMYTFIFSPPGARLPSPITHPIQLYGFFLAYQGASPRA